MPNVSMQVQDLVREVRSIYHAAGIELSEERREEIFRDAIDNLVPQIVGHRLTQIMGCTPVYVDEKDDETED